MAKHAKPRPPGKLRALVLGLMWTISAVLFLLNTHWLGLFATAIASLYLLSWKFEFD